MDKKYMRAVLLTGYGGPEKLEYRQDVLIPEVGPGEVLIQVGACGMNNTDIWTRENAYSHNIDPHTSPAWPPEPMHFPRIQGADIVGRIQAVGANVSPSRLGQRVIVNPTLYAEGDQGLLEARFIGSERDGGFAEFTVVPSRNAHPIRSSLSDAELATFPTAYLTAEHMLNRVNLGAGERVLITGASGGVGSALIQLAHIRGASVLAVTSSGKEHHLRQLGADVILNRDLGNFFSAARDALGGKSLDVVADVVAGEMFPVLLQLLRKKGRYVNAGAIAGPVVSLDLRTVYLKHLQLIGSTLGTTEEFSDLVSYIQSGKINPLLSKTYLLSDIHQAQNDFNDKQFFGKLVIIP